jgi:glycopeptide antibiotics resistance protein
MIACRPNAIKIILTSVYMLLLLASSVIPMDRHINGLQFVIDLKPTVQNLLHIPMFAVLSFLFLLILQAFQIENWKRNTIVLLSSGLFGLINEIIQIPVPGRYGGLTDILLNFAGAILGIIVFGLVKKSKSGLLRRIVCE